MKIDYLTLFPEMFDGVLNHSILKRAQDKEIINVNTINFRDYSVNKHNQVDDYPFGGGQGMVLKPEPVFNAMEDINRTDDTRVILMCPQGRPFTQDIAQELSEAKHIVFICGHYEGYDERIREHLVTDEISMGDYVLTGGELPAMTMTDAIVRLIPGVLGLGDVYKRQVLLSGNHAHIDRWRHEQKLIRTLNKRPDLLEQYDLTDKDKKIIQTYKNQLKND